MPEAVLEAQALTRRFGDFVAVDALTFSVQAGDVFGLLGANGVGKTVTLKMLTTLLPPTSGNARVAGFDIVRHAADVRRVIGYVPQLVSADGSLTGYENLRIFAKLYDIPPGDRELLVGKPQATLDDVFAHFASGYVEAGGSYRDVSKVPRAAQRLGWMLATPTSTRSRTRWMRSALMVVGGPAATASRSTWPSWSL